MMVLMKCALAEKCTHHSYIETILLDRRHISYDPAIPPKKHIHQSGDFDIEECNVQDVLVTVLNPNFRPFTVTIFNGHCTPLRKQWLLYDLLTANSITGIFDDSLFSVHTSNYGVSSEEACKSVSELEWGRMAIGV